MMPSAVVFVCLLTLRAEVMTLYSGSSKYRVVPGEDQLGFVATADCKLLALVLWGSTGLLGQTYLGRGP